jgi:hypothetical protein
LPPVEVDQDDIFGSQQVLAATCRRRKNQIRTDPDRKISGESRHETQPVQPFAELNKVAPKLVFCAVSIRDQRQLLFALYSNTFEPLKSNSIMERCILLPY